MNTVDYKHGLKICVGLLEIMIRNWNELETYEHDEWDLFSIENEKFRVADGLCGNVFFKGLGKFRNFETFVKQWKEFLGEDHTTNSYWLDGKDEYQTKNLYTNMKRLHCAIFIKNKMLDEIIKLNKKGV